jgi:hypothetical protein
MLCVPLSAPVGDFVVIWHEERWPPIKTIVQPNWTKGTKELC